MSKLNKLLHSWDEADTYLKEKIEKSKSEVLDEHIPYANTLGYVKENYFYNFNTVGVTQKGSGYFELKEDGSIDVWKDSGSDTAQYYLASSSRGFLRLPREVFVYSGNPDSAVVNEHMMRFTHGASPDALSGAKSLTNGLIIDNTNGEYDYIQANITIWSTFPHLDKVTYKPMLRLLNANNEFVKPMFTVDERINALEARIAVLENAIIDMASLMEE